MSRILTIAPRSFRMAGIGLGLSCFHFLNRGRLIANDSYAARPLTIDEIRPAQYKVQRSSHLQGKINYQHMSVGSFTGILCGYIVGKLSKLLVFLTVTSLLGVQFLETRGIIEVSSWPLAKQIVRWTRNHIDREFILDKPSFKISFLSSFIIAACYA
jgi:uncharacterized membrane protein (Fun14 family)